MQTDENTFTDKFLYPVCNLRTESLLYFTIYCFLRYSHYLRKGSVEYLLVIADIQKEYG